MKTNKHYTLRLVQKQGRLRAQDLVDQFGYSPATARSYPSYLKGQDLLERSTTGHTLTIKGTTRLQHFDVAGCPHPDCPLCKSKAGSFTCQLCGYQMPAKEARILPERDFLVVVRHAGVYCPWCMKLIFSESQALLLGIPKEGL